MIYLLLLIVGFVVLAGCASPVLAWVGSRMDKTTERYRQNLLMERRKNAVAEKALRAIVNNAGAPQLEASLALEEIDNLEDKELY